MTDTNDTTQDTKSKKNDRSEPRLSPDGKWRSFPKVPNLLQYVSTGVYFARVKVQGKLIRRSLETDVFTTAKLKLGDFIKKQHEPKPKTGTVGIGIKAYLRAVRGSHEISEQTKRYRRYCLRALMKSWPGLLLTRLEKLRLTRLQGEAFRDDPAFKQCQTWASAFSTEKDEHYFNNTLSVLRSILEIGGIPREQNPAYRVKRVGVKPTILQLPEPDQFQKMLTEIETSGAGQAQHCADLVRFLAYSGCRISEAQKVVWSDVDFKRGEIRVWNAKRAKKSNAHSTRQVPIIPPMRELLERLKVTNPLPSQRVCVLGECQKSLTRACERVGTPVITHHDLRHLFATRCIEAGVDIPTVSRWLGHSDGGALAMKTYGHLRREHSAAMAQRVTFGEPKAEDVKTPEKKAA
jgi:integrase